ncbi:MAG: hypothetical protein J6B50_09485 [Lachnospiraceae bacterium]|nr:hypothetical protein [Lachnospiraceae bacterium]MBP3593941.1 hypothetical protein [Lachnospiraceae bacterium]
MEMKYGYSPFYEEVSETEKMVKHFMEEMKGFSPEQITKYVRSWQVRAVTDMARRFDVIKESGLLNKGQVDALAEALFEYGDSSAKAELALHEEYSFAGRLDKSTLESTYFLMSDLNEIFPMVEEVIKEHPELLERPAKEMEQKLNEVIEKNKAALYSFPYAVRQSLKPENYVQQNMEGESLSYISNGAHLLAEFFERLNPRDTMDKTASVAINKLYHTEKQDLEFHAFYKGNMGYQFRQIFDTAKRCIKPWENAIMALEDMTYLSHKALLYENKLVKENVVDYHNHSAKERAEFIKTYLLRMRDILSGEMFSKLRMDAICDNSPEVRAEMVRHGYVEEMKKDPSPVVQEALKEYLKEHPYMTQVAYDKEPVFKMHKSKEAEPGR